MTDMERIRELEHDVAKLTRTVRTLMAWIVGSANSPLSVAELEQLVAMLPEAW